MTDHTKDLEAEARRMEAFTRDELASDMQEDRGKVIEALVFMAGQMARTGEYEEYGPHVAALADVAEALSWGVGVIKRHDERQAFTRRALENEVAS